MSRPPDVDPTAVTHTDESASPRVVWTTPSSRLPPVDPRADTIPSDGALTTPPPSGLANDPLLGHMLGHFRIDGLIGRGGMGTVYRAWDVSLLRPVALKVLLSDSASARTRFLREARSQAQLRHPNVVPIHYVGESEGIVFLVMDLVEGESLNDLIRREGRVASERALDIVDAVASALAAGHAAGLIHRDVKPSNILLERSGRALLADFGLAKDIAAIEITGDAEAAPTSVQTAGLTRAGSIVGTPAYLAPEQAAGGQVDHRADMYALGASLFEALTGAPPFDAPTPTAIVEQQRTEVVRSPRALVADLHPSLEQLVLRLMHRDPAGRFLNYEELRTALTQARMPAMVKAPPVPRLVAFGIDYTLFGTIGGIVFGGMAGLGLRARPVAWVVAVLGAALLEWRLGGTSLGKRLMQMRTSDRYGLAPGFGVITARTFFKALGPALAWVEITVLSGQVAGAAAFVTMLVWIASFLPALGKSRLALHDRLTRTRVIFAEAPAARGERSG
jgi:uncharacterized RDD family membrane protein YckC